MKNLKVGAKIILGFGIVLLMMLVTFATVWISSTLTINNSRNVDVITTLQSHVIDVTNDFLEARAQANILYNSSSASAYKVFAQQAQHTDETFVVIFDFINQHDELASFLESLNESKSAFDTWVASVNALRSAQNEKAEAFEYYVLMNEKMNSLAGNAFAGQLNALSYELKLEGNLNNLAAHTKLLNAAHILNSDILNIRIASVDFSHIYNQESFDELISSLDVLIQTIDENLAMEGHNAANTNTLNYISQAVVKFRQAAVDFGEASKKVESLSEQSVPLGYAAGDRFSEADRYMAQTVDNVVSDTINSANFYLIIVMLISLASAVLAIVIAVLTARSITKPLKFLSEYIAEVANTGNLGLVAENRERCEKYSRNHDEVGATVLAANSLFDLMEHQGNILRQIASKDISRSVVPRSDKSTVELIAVELLDELNNVMTKIHDSSAQVSSGAKQIADGAQALASGTTQQAAAVEELSSSISNVSQKSKDNSNMAVRAATLGENIRKSAEKSSSQMDSMVQAVNEISEASRSISKVIGVIDSIAFQTNILALNAAVEAARAGQHGKGFAVVAEEVRSLASKSAAAAKDTGSLISNSMEKAELGAKLALETAESLAEIVSGIQESSRIVTDIAKSSEEQTTAIAEIDNGITQVAKVVHQNSATSEESASAAQQMSEQSETLAALTAEFTLRDNAGALDSGYAKFFIEQENI